MREVEGNTQEKTGKDGGLCPKVDAKNMGSIWMADVGTPWGTHFLK